MFNAQKPSLEELPSSAQLIRSTVFAAIAAIAVLVTVVLPAEYGVDPTGAGGVLGLTEMGEIKQELADEAEQDEKIHLDQSSGLMQLFVASAQAQEAWRDEVRFTLAPGDFTEIKMQMLPGQRVDYIWVGEGGRINFDLHAHGEGQSTTYEKGRGKTKGEGSFEAPFAGEHGWFWRNRDKTEITVILRIDGDYSALLQ